MHARLRDSVTQSRANNDSQRRQLNISGPHVSEAGSRGSALMHAMIVSPPKLLDQCKDRDSASFEVLRQRENLGISFNKINLCQAQIFVIFQIFKSIKQTHWRVCMQFDPTRCMNPYALCLRNMAR